MEEEIDMLLAQEEGAHLSGLTHAALAYLPPATQKRCATAALFSAAVAEPEMETNSQTNCAKCVRTIAQNALANEITNEFANKLRKMRWHEFRKTNSQTKCAK